MGILVWNCSGAASQSFNRLVKELIRIHKPDIMSLVVPRISGVQADSTVCIKMGLNHWIRVEAEGKTHSGSMDLAI